MISNTLIEKTLSYFEKFKSKTVIVSPSLPILYFGDITAYKKSDLKIVTVGKNPSNNEFRLNSREDYSFARFSKWNENKKNLIESLNPYFEDKPLEWFSCFEPILNGLSASYYQNRYSNIALHTDICSPLATSPTWSNLEPEIQAELYKEGHEIWKELIEELQPDIMFVSIKQSLFNLVFKSKGEELISFHHKKDETPRRKPYIVKVYKYQLLNKKISKVVYGQDAQKPFGTISDQQKYEIGKILTVMTQRIS